MSFDWKSHTVKPKLVVFDLDYTLWPFWVDSHVDPPFSKERSGVIKDRRGAIVKHYPQVPEILNELKKSGFQIGIASRTSEIHGANQLLGLFNWEKFIDYREIYPGCKITHFERISQKSKLPLSEMLFFDDESRNIRDLQGAGVVSVLVKNGVDRKCIEEGFQLFVRSRT